MPAERECVRLGSAGPMASGDGSATGGQTFRFRFDPRYRMAALPFGITDAGAWVRVGPSGFEARFGPWAVRTPVDNLAGSEVSGPFGFLRTAGSARLSFSDRGLTFATNGDEGLCVRFHEPVRGIDLAGVIRHPGLTVTVADVGGLRRAIEQLT